VASRRWRGARTQAQRTPRTGAVGCGESVALAGGAAAAADWRRSGGGSGSGSSERWTVGAIAARSSGPGRRAASVGARSGSIAARVAASIAMRRGRQCSAAWRCGAAGDAARPAYAARRPSASCGGGGLAAEWRRVRQRVQRAVDRRRDRGSVVGAAVGAGAAGRERRRAIGLDRGAGRGLDRDAARPAMRRGRRCGAAGDPARPAMRSGRQRGAPTIRRGDARCARDHALDGPR